MAWEHPGGLLAMQRILILVLRCSTIGLLASTFIAVAQTPDTLQHARGLLEHGHLADAGHTLESLLQRHPSNPDAWTLLGVVRVQQHEAAKGEECFRKALSIRPD